MSFNNLFRPLPKRRCSRCQEPIYPKEFYYLVTKNFFGDIPSQLDPSAESYHRHCLDIYDLVLFLSLDETVSVTLKADEDHEPPT